MSKDSSPKYHQNNKEKFQKKSRERYQSLFKEEKQKMWQYGHEWYKKLPEEKQKQKLIQYRKKYCKMRKKYLIIIIKNFCFKK